MNYLSDRPRLKPKLSLQDYLLEVLSGAGLFILISLIAVNWHLLDPEIFFSYNLKEEELPLYGDKAQLLVVGFVASLLYLVLTLLGSFPHVLYYPVQINEYNGQRHYQLMQNLIRWLKLEVVGSLLFCSFLLIMLGNGMVEQFNPSNILIFVFLIVVTVGIYKHRARQYVKRHHGRAKVS